MFPRWPLSAEIKVQTAACLKSVSDVSDIAPPSLSERPQDFFFCFVSGVRRAAEALRAIGGESCAEEPQLSLKPPSVKSRDRHFLLKPALSLTFTPVYLKEDHRVITGTLSHLKMGCSLWLQPDWINDIIIMSKPDWRIALTQNHVILYGGADLLSPPAVKQKRS